MSSRLVPVLWLPLALLALPAAAGGKNLANGMSCTFDSDCESGRCSFKVCKSR